MVTFESSSSNFNKFEGVFSASHLREMLFLAGFGCEFSMFDSVMTLLCPNTVMDLLICCRLGHRKDCVFFWKVINNLVASGLKIELVKLTL